MPAVSGGQHALHAPAVALPGDLPRDAEQDVPGEDRTAGRCSAPYRLDAGEAGDLAVGERLCAVEDAEPHGGDRAAPPRCACGVTGHGLSPRR
ncbi:hypothetical protein ACFRCI_08880 [Streptomyces sp. NPDC056638]|uniref:hypothetical protein n=1 Tax=Streptomyces sp. NPDC056638 TaxID=3345887 RepID=UPI0036B315FC